MIGSIYVLVALGMVLIYGVMHVVNFAHGMLFALGAYFAQFFFSQILDNYLLAILFSIVVLVLIGAVIEHAVFKPLRDNMRNQVIAALGLILFFQNLVIVVWGPEALDLPVKATSGTVRLGPIAFSVQQLLIIVVTLTSIGLMYLFLTRTKFGTAVRATSQDREAAMVVGIDVNQMHKVTFGIGMALAALGGSLVGPAFLIFPTMGDVPLIKALAAILLGGLGSVFGAVLGALLIGVSDSVVTMFIATDYRDTITFLIIIAVLLLRPHGLFGRTVRGET